MEAELRKVIGQHLHIGIPGTQASSEIDKIIEDIHPGGIILFGENYVDLKQLVELNQYLHDFCKNNSLNALSSFIGVDHEGGRVQRFKEPFTHFSALAEWGEENSSSLCFERALRQGQELKAAGISINYAPVLDLNECQSKAILDRSLSSDPKVVSALGSALIRGYLKAGILPVAKHFPGHGSVKEDSHYDLPVSKKSLKMLIEEDLVPFKKALKSKLPAIMLSHVIYKEIDEGVSATFSKKIVNELIYKECRAKNVLIFSDDMDMKAITKQLPIEQSVEKALRAGIHQLLLCHSFDSYEFVTKHLVDVALKDKSFEEKLYSNIDIVKKIKYSFLEDKTLKLNLNDAEDIINSEFVEN